MGNPTTLSILYYHLITNKTAMKLGELLDRKVKIERTKAKLVDDDFIPSGIPMLDKLMKGYHKGSLNLVASRPGMGNTITLCSLAYYACLNLSRVLIVSLQHSSDDILNRLIYLAAGSILHGVKYSYHF